MIIIDKKFSVFLIAILAIILLVVLRYRQPIHTYDTSQFLMLHPEYKSVVLERPSQEKDIIILFAALEEGNKNLYGDIVKINNATGESTIISKFNSSQQSILDTFNYLDKTSFEFTEERRLGGEDSLSIGRIIYLEDTTKNLLPPNLTDNTGNYIYRHDIKEISSYNEHISAYTWIGSNNVTFSRYFTDTIGNVYPTETWQYNVETGEYTLISEDK